MGISELKDFGKREKYYQFKRTFEAGLLEANEGIPVDKVSRMDYNLARWKNKLYNIELYSEEGRLKIIERNRHLRLEMHKRGIKYEDCYYAGTEGECESSSLKGFIRLEKRMVAEELAEQLRSSWCVRGRKSEVRVKECSGIGEILEYLKVTVYRHALDGDCAWKPLIKSAGWR